MAHALIQVLQAQHPQAHLAILAPKSTLPITELMPEIQERFLLEDGHKEFNFKRRWRLARQIRRQHFDVAYILPNTLKSAVIPFLAGIPKRIGWKGESRYVLLNDLRKNVEALPLMVGRYVALAYPDGAFKAGDAFPYPKLTIPGHSHKNGHPDAGRSSAGKKLVISPSAAYGPAKRWPSEYFAAVAKAKLDEGWKVQMIGAPSDQEVAEAILTVEPRIESFVGKTSLVEMATLIAQSDQMLTNDSGPMHIGAAFEIPLVAIFGSSSPGFTPPLGEKVCVIEKNDLPCKPCFQRTCPFGHYNCLREITPQHVLKALA